MQRLMPMGILFDVDGLSQLSMSVLVCARCFQLHLTRLVHLHMIVPVKSDTNVTQHTFNDAHWC